MLWLLVGVSLAAALVTSVSAHIKIQVLHYIDSAIFLPLFKVLGPAIVIVFGLVFFGESFSVMEWVGLLVSLSVPILLVSRVEQTRQNNLTLGLVLIGVCAVTSAIAAALQKWATEIQNAPLWIITMIGVGVMASAVVQYLFKYKSVTCSHCATAVSISKTCPLCSGINFPTINPCW